MVLVLDLALQCVHGMFMGTVTHLNHFDSRMWLVYVCRSRPNLTLASSHWVSISERANASASNVTLAS